MLDKIYMLINHSEKNGIPNFLCLVFAVSWNTHHSNSILPQRARAFVHQTPLFSFSSSSSFFLVSTGFVHVSFMHYITSYPISTVSQFLPSVLPCPHLESEPKLYIIVHLIPIFTRNLTSVTLIFLLLHPDTRFV